VPAPLPPKPALANNQIEELKEFLFEYV